MQRRARIDTKDMLKKLIKEKMENRDQEIQQVKKVIRNSFIVALIMVTVIICIMLFIKNMSFEKSNTQFYRAKRNVEYKDKR
jgi:hypothetical protein